MKQLNSEAVWLFFISFIFKVFFRAILFLFIFVYFLDENILISFLNSLFIIVPIIIALCLFWAKLTYNYYRYELTDLGFRKELGVIYKKYVTIPYDRIQNVDINRGILARILGLSDLNIQTAGMSGSIGFEGRLPGLSQKDAEQLRDELILRASKANNRGL